jgi:hypothetical protein
MYKLREARLKEFYTLNESAPSFIMETTTTIKKSASTHGDSLPDQSFESFKTKEIRDSESPTR